MKSKYLLIIVLFIVSKVFSQDSSHLLFTIDGDAYYSEEFLTVYQKNLKLVADNESNIDDYLKLFIDYKLKVKEAKLISLDTFQKFKNELKQYKNNLVKPYLKDKEVTKKLVSEAYNRFKKEVNVSHILIFINEDVTPKDTLTVYNKLIEARNLILKGADFGAIAKKYSEDPTVNENLGSVGYFTVLQMVYPFENIAYTTPVNEISMPFKTKFGYHILKVNDIRESKGEVEVAHIMFRSDSISAKQRIDSVYRLLQDTSVNFGELAKKVSEDKASRMKGGKLTKFGSGKMVADFSKVAFSLTKEGEISTPFKTQFGWHIIKLIKKYPIQSFEEIETKLTQKVEKDMRSNLVSKSIINKLLKQYNVTVNEKAFQQFSVDNWIKNSENFNQDLLEINGEQIPQTKFISYLKTARNSSFNKAFEAYKEKEVLNYYKEHIEISNPEFATTYKEFKEGLLLFDLLNQEVWEKAKNSEGLLNYFNSNKDQKYKGKALNNIKGSVISDYQNYLELIYSNKLRNKYKVTINKSEKKRIKKLKF